MVYGSDVRKGQGNPWNIVSVLHMSTNQNKQKTIIHESFEQLSELGRDTARKAVKEITSTFNPLAANFENPTKKERENGNNNFSDLDFEKLQKQYDGQDASQLDAARAQLSGPDTTNPKQQEYDYHRRVKREEEEYQLKKEQEEEEEERQEAYEEQQKKQLEEERRQAQSQGSPKGKIRKSILGGKGSQKSSSELPPELKSDAGRG